MATCLFCRGDYDPDKASDEHLIPDALGGWITNRLICTTCNNKLGTEVDAVSGASPFFQLRKEAGLKPASIPVEYPMPGVATPIEAKLTGDGELIDTRKVYLEEKTLLIIDDTPEKVQQHLDAINEGRRKRNEPEFTGPGPEHRPAGEAPVRIEATPMEVAALRTKLTRLAAKMAIEHIGMTSSPAEALKPELDPLREFALNGKGDPTYLGVQAGSLPGTYWLPRTKQALVLNQGLDVDVPQSGVQPKDSEEVKTLNHVLVFSVNDRYCLFSVLLFGLIQLNVILPCDLDVPWGKLVARDLLTGKEPVKSPVSL
jgi:hypothetical protein